MKRYYIIAVLLLLATACKKETGNTEAPAEAPKPEGLYFRTETYSKKTSLPCKGGCTSVSIELPVAENIPIVADSINKKIFNTVRGIVYFGEKPSDGKSYEEVMASFIGAYDKMKKDFPNDPMLPWEARINGETAYRSESIVNILIKSYMFTGGAHGYGAERSLLFDATTGRSLTNEDIFTDIKGVTAFAEKKFREKFKVPAGKNINATGFMFEGDKFALPQNIFFTKEGLLLYYNPYEIASYAEQQKELLLPYDEVGIYLKVK
ncbi:hypothetical protein CHU92_09610 [Flavobacterium cyanobacteriorum]|uniref:DUF3298/DUF4163 domain-containing protein n=1 Tax=Flavobacterium cyanobacteriorum TaxID=2022802 RepID=A0A255Z5D4_9FLAO|nr:DUF3298 and DUF4163 domain-containing protein [Flavobacterium cyanobacteriorum]OYQ36641.1 hypothetical protein CHU92_09610 [Flavobacterium cyanobacteriorum]